MKPRTNIGFTSDNKPATDILLNSHLPQRFIEKISVDPESHCWNWTGATHSPARYPERKYGEFHLCWEGRRQRVVGSHRLVYETVNGPLLPGLRLDVDHTCHNSLCVNPKHLRAITHCDNLRLRRPFQRRAQ